MVRLPRSRTASWVMYGLRIILTAVLLIIAWVSGWNIPAWLWVVGIAGSLIFGALGARAKYRSRESEDLDSPANRKPGLIGPQPRIRKQHGRSDTRGPAV